MNLKRNKAWKAQSHYRFKLTKEQKSRLRKLQYASQFNRNKSMAQLNSYKGTLDRIRRDAAAEEWNMNGQIMSRQDVMFKVIEWVSEGNSLKMFSDQPGAPAVGTIYRWFKNYPQFEKDFRSAEEASAHILADKALLEVIHLSDREEVPVVKLRYDALTRRAAQMNQRFQDKQVYRQEEDVKTVSDEELNRRREELMSKVKEQLRSEGWSSPKEIDVQAEESKEKGGL